MKKSFLFFLLIAGFVACDNPPKPSTEPIDNGGPQDDPDLVAINGAIHGFYTWYQANEKPLLDINYVKPGKPATLDMKKLDAYFDLLKQSGYISQAYVDGEKAYLQNLEATVWKNENVSEEPLTGLDYERLFCAQDWDIAFWKTASVTAEQLGTDRTTAIMSGDEVGGPKEQKFEVVKEQGKWLIAKILCGTDE